MITSIEWTSDSEYRQIIETLQDLKSKSWMLDGETTRVGFNASLQQVLNNIEEWELSRFYQCVGQKVDREVDPLTSEEHILTSLFFASLASLSKILLREGDETSLKRMMEVVFKKLNPEKFQDDGYGLDALFSIVLNTLIKASKENPQDETLIEKCGVYLKIMSEKKKLPCNDGFSFYFGKTRMHDYYCLLTALQGEDQRYTALRYEFILKILDLLTQLVSAAGKIIEPSGEFIRELITAELNFAGSATLTSPNRLFCQDYGGFLCVRLYALFEQLRFSFFLRSSQWNSALLEIDSIIDQCIEDLCEFSQAGEDDSTKKLYLSAIITIWLFLVYSSPNPCSQISESFSQLINSFPHYSALHLSSKKEMELITKHLHFLKIFLTHPLISSHRDIQSIKPQLLELYEKNLGYLSKVYRRYQKEMNIGIQRHGVFNHQQSRPFLQNDPEEPKNLIPAGGLNMT